jgi:hypothetical protein
MIIEDLDIERMAAQVAEQIRTRVILQGHLTPSIIPGHWTQTIESRILLQLIAAEQTGTFMETVYDVAGLYDGYDTPQEVYTLWIYSGEG